MFNNYILIDQFKFTVENVIKVEDVVKVQNATSRKKHTTHKAEYVIKVE